MIGADDLAFPRLNLASWYLYLAGGVIVLARAVPRRRRHRLDLLHAVLDDVLEQLRRADAGRRLRRRLLVDRDRAQLHRHHPHACACRAWAGSSLPLFVWATYATSLILVLATPVLAITTLLAVAERLFQIGVFDPAHGGDPLLFQHLFWFYSHPAVYIMVLPAMGVVSEIIPCFAQQAHLRLPLHGLRDHGHRGGRLSGLGPPHVRLRPVGGGEPGLLAALASSSRCLRRSRSSTGRRRSTRASSASTRRCSTPSASSACSRSAACRASSSPRSRSTCTSPTPTSSSPISTTSWSAAR